MTKRVLVTGGARGVGAAIVRALAEAGHDVDFTYRSSIDAADDHQQVVLQDALPSPLRGGPSRVSRDRGGGAGVTLPSPPLWGRVGEGGVGASVG